MGNKLYHKTGKSTAPGDDEVTYKILEALTRSEDQPLLFWFNMSSLDGLILKDWKNATIIPMPKHTDPDLFKLISCIFSYCQILERILLNRLLGRINNKSHNMLKVFLEGKNTAHCLTSLSNRRAKCCVYRYSRNLW